MVLVGIVLIIVVGVWVLMRRQDRRWREFQERQEKDQTMQVLTEWLKDMRGSLEVTRYSLRTGLDRDHPDPVPINCYDRKLPGQTSSRGRYVL